MPDPIAARRSWTFLEQHGSEKPGGGAVWWGFNVGVWSGGVNVKGGVLGQFGDVRGRLLGGEMMTRRCCGVSPTIQQMGKRKPRPKRALVLVVEVEGAPTVGRWCGDEVRPQGVPLLDSQRSTA
jgi:hypothetical protein